MQPHAGLCSGTSDSAQVSQNSAKVPRVQQKCVWGSGKRDRSAAT